MRNNESVYSIYMQQELIIILSLMYDVILMSNITPHIFSIQPYTQLPISTENFYTGRIALLVYLLKTSTKKLQYS